MKSSDRDEPNSSGSPRSSSHAAATVTSPRKPLHGPIAAALLGFLLGACGATPSEDSARRSEHPIVHGTDDRTEYFDVADAQRKAVFRESLVALIPNTSLVREGDRVELSAPSWGEAETLCEGEPFFDQPAAAFCSGVLLDWDLILTAGHCLRKLALRDFSVVFDYYYQAPGQLAIHEGDIYRPLEIVTETLDRAMDEPRLDYAWLRLDGSALPPRRPAAVHTKASVLATGDALLSFGTGGGVPLKLDAGGSVIDARPGWFDYFVADTDTSHGASGGAALDLDMALLGTLARGATDTVPQPGGCHAMVREPDGERAAEQFTYAQAALAGLCASEGRTSSLCRADCDDVCRALPLPRPLTPRGGCAMARARAAPGTSSLGLAAVAWLLLGVRKRARRSRLLADRCFTRAMDPFT